MGKNERLLLVCSGNQRTNAGLSVADNVVYADKPQMWFISVAVWISNLYEKKWDIGGLYVVGLGAMLAQAVVRADPPRWQLQALAMNCADHMVSSHSDGFGFFPRVTLKFTRESHCRVSWSASTFSGLESRCPSAKPFNYQFMYQAQVPVHA